MLREAVLDKYGRKCAVCPWDDIDCLQLDHVNGDGHEERRQMNSMAIYQKALVDVEGRYQLLCANHNFKKRLERYEDVKRFDTDDLELTEDPLLNDELFL